MMRTMRDDRNYDVIIYHGGCPDGIGAAWAAWKHLGDSALYIPMLHDQSVPETTIRGKRVLMVDFAFKRAKHLLAVGNAEQLVVVDHHIKAMEDIGDLPNTHFDMDHSGAVLAWSHFTGDVWDSPTVLRYIEDRDLWKWEMSQTKEYLASFDSYPLAIETVEKFANKPPHWAIAEGEVISRYKDVVVDRMLETACRGAFVDSSIYEPTIGLCNVNCKDFTSDVCNKMIYDWGFDVAGAWYYDGACGTDLVRVSLRSRKGSGVSVANIAAKFGGGGHENAAGFQIEGKDLTKVFDFPLIAVA